MPGRDPQPGRLGPAPDEWELVRRRGTKPRPRPDRGEVCKSGHERACPLDHAADDPTVDSRVPSHELTRRSNEHLPGDPRLHVERDGLAGHDVRARQIAELHDLVAAEAWMAFG